MKKNFLLIFVLILTAACSAPPPASREAAPAASPSPAAVAMTEADAIAKEKAIWETIKNKDYLAFGNMLADDSIEVTSEGVFDKAASIAGIKEFEPSEAVFSDWKFLSIDKDAFLISYTVKVKGKYKGKEFPEESGRATSAWVSRGSKWLAIYHQESPLKPPMPPPAATKSPAAAAASPASFPAVPATGPDPIANDKIVWDLFKAKNYEAFAALLTPDFFEVESDGVYDKASAVKGVSGFDASKVELSDWKTVSLDADAALVTYTSKMPPMASMPGMSKDGERGTSIWVKRDGKWLGLFHQGSTPVEKPAPTAVPKEVASPAAKAPAKNP